MSVTLTIEGLDKINRMLDPVGFDRAVDKSLDLSVQVWRDDTKKLPPVSAKRDGYNAKGIPVDTGLTRQRIESQRLSKLAAGVIARTNYSDYVHDGTSRVPPRPFFKWTLELGTMDKIGQIFTDQFSRFLNGK